MNAQDRKTVAKLLGELNELKSKAEEIGNQLRELADAEQEKFDNMSEGLRQAENGQKIERAAENLSSAADSCEEGNIQETIDSLEQIEE
jgi:hypothetical protein